MAIKQAQESTKQAIADGAQLVEVEFPAVSLNAVAGDAEGSNEATESSRRLRDFCRAYQNKAANVRVFFPDQGEYRVATLGKAMDPNAGSREIMPIWTKTGFALDYLTKPSGLLDIGIDLSGFKPEDRLKPTDEVVIAAYPSFDPRELVAVDRVWNALKMRQTVTPLILFNAELDRLRNGYYPSLFYPQMARLTREMIPQVLSAYYVHNFKGTQVGGVLFRAYPGDWQVYLRTRERGLILIEQLEERPSLREVALNIIPRAAREMR